MTEYEGFSGYNFIIDDTPIRRAALRAINRGRIRNYRSLKKYFAIAGITLSIFAAKKIYSNYINMGMRNKLCKYTGIGCPKKKVTNGRLVKRIRRLEKGQTGKELKQKDILAYNEESLTTTASVVLITGIEQGNTSLTREGLWVKLHSIQMIGQFMRPANNAGPVLVELALVCDRRNQGEDPSWADVFESDALTQFKEHDEGSRFKILFRKRFDCTRTDATTASYRMFKYYKRFKNPVNLQYSGTGATVASVTKNSHFLLIRSNAASASPTATINCRIRYTD